MITLTGINKRHGHQVLFVDASLQVGVHRLAVAT